MSGHVRRNTQLRRLKQHIPGYEKGAGGTFSITSERMETAMQRAQQLAMKFNAYSVPEPYTAIVELVKLLTTLRV